MRDNCFLCHSIGRGHTCAPALWDTSEVAWWTLSETILSVISQMYCCNLNRNASRLKTCDLSMKSNVCAFFPCACRAECDKLRKDGFRSSQYYSQGPTFSDTPQSGSSLHEDDDDDDEKKVNVPCQSLSWMSSRADSVQRRRWRTVIACPLVAVAGISTFWLLARVHAEQTKQLFSHLKHVCFCNVGGSSSRMRFKPRISEQ